MATMLELFKAAGYEDYSKMPLNTGVVPLNPIEILSYDADSKKNDWRKVDFLFYKGNCSNGFEVEIDSKLAFLCTPNHRFLAKILPDGRAIEGPWSNCEWKTAAELPEEFYGFSDKGEWKLIRLKPTTKEFPVLDMQVAGTECYFSGGILSHNTFGGTAKLFANGLKYINPYLSKYGTSMIVINQERANIGGMYGPDFTCVAAGTEIIVDE